MTDGRLDLDQLHELVRNGQIDTVVCGFPDAYGRLLGKRLDASFFLESAGDGTHVCDYLLAVDMEMEPVSGYDIASWDQGFGDLHLVPDLATLRKAAWLDRTAIVVCDASSADDDHPVAVAPRNVLRRQVERASTAGFVVMAASELEYYLYRTSYAEAARTGYRDLTAAGWYLEDYHLLQGARTEDLNGTFRRHLTASGIPVESTKGEWGRGQHEVNVRFAEVLEMADRHVLLKQCLKETADAAGASVTFMAKPDAAEAGSSSHVHVSLWRDGDNAFATDDDTFRWFLGGWMAGARELAAFYAPTVNSYKRYQPQSWAPTAIAWSTDNRTAGFRIVGAGPARRIECRLPGADVNPYLAYAAVLASGLDGIERRIEPPAAFVGDVYAAGDLPQVPASLEEAVDALAGGTLGRVALGDEVVDHYLHFFRTEADAYRRAVTDWERTRYFERI
ncbi:MAG TPA: glutamine synthetase family protein [Acidimicrobiales bacterium]|nr:glutamine synthetase family protein [Acidimicrobiales bacterium]